MPLAVRFAERSVGAFRDESGEARNLPGDAFDCEAFLQMGIQSFEWLVRGDQVYRAAIYKGEKHNSDIEKAIEDLFRKWLDRGKFANEWVATLLKRGDSVDNLAEFRQCEEEAAAIVAFLDSNQNDAELPEAMRALRDKAISEHRNGETAEFF